MVNICWCLGVDPLPSEASALAIDGTSAATQVTLILLKSYLGSLFKRINVTRSCWKSRIPFFIIFPCLWVCRSGGFSTSRPYCWNILRKLTRPHASSLNRWYFGQQVRAVAHHKHMCFGHPTENTASSCSSSNVLFNLKLVRRRGL